jgi:TRAP-type transport system small permease protein
MDMAVRVNTLISLLENIALAIGGIAMMIIMVVVSSDAASRYVFNAPFEASYDVISLYGLVLIGYMPMSATFRQGGHVSVPLFYELFPLRVQKPVRLLVNLLTLAICALLLVLAFKSTLEAHQTNEVRLGVVMFAVWPSYFVIALGFLIICARFVFSTFLLIFFGRDPFVIQDGEISE